MKFKKTNLNQVLSTGLGIFLITGLSGCQDSKKEKDSSGSTSSFIPVSTSTSSSSKSSGYFSPSESVASGHGSSSNGG